jgi:hypothetical protein
VSGFPTIDTFASLIDEVITSLQGFGVNNDQVLTLTEAVGPTTTTLSTDAAATVGRGIVEIDEELIYVLTTGNGSMVCQPWGRGWKGTAATAHDAGVPIFVSPVYPRSIVAREINNTIRAVYPNLFAVNTADITATSDGWQYELPADVDRVLSVEWKWDLAEGWLPIKSWETTFSAREDDFSTGKFISIGEPLPSGVTVHITYATEPVLLQAADDTFASSGLPSSSRDVIVYGAASRLVPWIDSGRVPVTTVPSDAQDTQKQIGNAVSIGRELRNLYQVRLAEERQALLVRYPMKSHRVR